MDWKVLFNIIASAAVAGGAAGVTSLQTQPVAPWQVHAAAAGAGALLYLAGHLRQSPLPAKP